MTGAETGVISAVMALASAGLDGAMAATRRGSAIRERKNVRALVISYRYRRQATWIAFAMYFKSGAVREQKNQWSGNESLVTGKFC
jgi:hypothetical protein